MLWRWVARAVVAALLISAGAVLVVDVDAGGASGASCGSALDVVTGRADWEEWWARDLADPVEGPGGRLVRTEDCPGAVNVRIVAAAVLAAAAAAVLVVEQIVASDRRPTPRTELSAGQRIRRLGGALAWVGVTLTLGGVAAIVALLADPDSTLFLYVDRLVVAIIGAIVLVPAIALVFAGRALELAGRHLTDREMSDANP